MWLHYDATGAVTAITGNPGWTKFDATGSPVVPSGGSGAPTTVDYLVGTSSGSLSAEIVVGTSPGGELGGTWASPTVDATHAGSTHIALGATEPGAVSTTTSGTAGAGATASKVDHSHDLGFDDATSNPLAVSTAASDGTEGSAARKDHVHAHETAHIAHDTLWDTAGDLVVGTGADTAAKLAISVPAANILNVLGVANGETTWSVKAIHDATNPAAIGTVSPGTSLLSAHRDHVHATGAGTPSTQAFGDAAATGSGPAAAMTDHKHAMPADPVTAHAAASDPHTGYVLESLLDAKGDLIAASADNTPAKVTVGADDTILMADSGQAAGLKWVASASPSTQAFGDSAVTGTGDTFTRGDHKHAMPTLGYGLSGNSAPAVGLTNSTALATATTSISAATYADVTGLSLSLAAGTWLLIARVVGSIVNAQAIMHVAITDNGNTVVQEGSQGIGASGTASVAQLGNCVVVAVVSPGATTTYKVRAARGLTTITGTWTAMDGAGFNTTNNLTDNSDKGSSLIAVRIA